MSCIMRGAETNNQLTEAANVLMTHEEYKYVELPNSQVKLMKPLGWEVKLLQVTQTAQLLRFHYDNHHDLDDWEPEILLIKM